MRQICERKLCNGRTEGAYLGEDWQFGSKFSGDFGKESVGSLPAHWIFCEERVSWRPLCVRLVQ
jgi:hypothetical protein